jgi:hypothetical protein
MGGCGYIGYIPFLDDGRGEGLLRGRTFSFIIGRICAAFNQTMGKFDFLIKEEQPKQADTVCVSRHKDCKVDDAREFIVAFALVDIPKSPIQDVSLIVSLGQIIPGFNTLLRPFLIEAFQRDDPATVSMFNRDVECIATTY